MRASGWCSAAMRQLASDGLDRPGPDADHRRDLA
jgi:hypothetical protein